jgi:hypothetical protein
MKKVVNIIEVNINMDISGHLRKYTKEIKEL